MSKDFLIFLVQIFCLGVGIFFSIGLGNTIMPQGGLGILPFLLGYAIIALPIASLFAYLLFKSIKSLKSSPVISSIVLVVLVISSLAMNIYGNYRYGKLFTMPFLGVKNVPFSILETDPLEKKCGFHLYLPNVIPNNLRPDFMRTCSSYGITFVYQEKGQPSEGAPLEITEKRAGSMIEVENKIKNNEVVYKTIPLSNGATLWYQTQNNAEMDFNRRMRTHYVIFNDVQVALEFDGFDMKLPPETEVIKIAESLK